MAFSAFTERNELLSHEAVSMLTPKNDKLLL